MVYFSVKCERLTTGNQDHIIKMSSEESDDAAIQVVLKSRILKQLNCFIEKYPGIREPDKFDLVDFDDEFRQELNSICENLSVMEISDSNDENRMVSILTIASNILKHFTNVDVIKSLSFIDYHMCIKLATVIIRLKFMLVFCLYENLSLNSNPISTDSFLKDNLEKYLTCTFKNKINKFKSNHDEDEVQVTNVLFTTFLLEYLKFVAMCNTHPYSEPSIKKYIEILIEVGDSALLLLNYHHIFFLFSETNKVSILQKITTFCVENSYPIQNSELLLSVDNDFKKELIILGYFTLQHLCKYLELQNLNQSSQLLSNTSVNRIFSSVDPIKLYNIGLEKTNGEPLRLILKEYKNIKAVPSNEIKKCLVILEALLCSSKKYNTNFSVLPFITLLLSLLFEFVMATDLDKLCITSLIDVIIGVIHEIPRDFKAVTYAYKIYQKLKSDYDLELKAKQLFEKMSINAQLPNTKQYIIKDLEEIMCSEKNGIDVPVIASCFLHGPLMDESVDSLFYALNESVILASQHIPINHVLFFPYCVMLNRSFETKNEDCIVNNLSVLDDYLTIIMDKNQNIPENHKNSFLNVVFNNYKDFVHFLPKEFLEKCLEFTITPLGMDLSLFKKLIILCDSKIFTKFIELLKTETTKLIEGNESTLNDEYYAFMHEVWVTLLNMQKPLTFKTRKIRKDLVNHFCFTLNRTFLFNKDKVPTEQGLMLLIKTVSSFLQIPWINTAALMNCSLRIITFVEKKNISKVAVLTEATELLIVLYKCPNNSIKPHLGLYIITFVNILKKCCSFVKNLKYQFKNDLNAPFHKLEKCSNLFKQNKDDFVFINRYAIESLLEIIAVRNSLPNFLMKHCQTIIHNLIDVSSDDELKLLMMTIHGQSVKTLKEVYMDHVLCYRFDGRV